MCFMLGVHLRLSSDGLFRLGMHFMGFYLDMSKQHGVLLRCTLEVQLMGSDLSSSYLKLA